MKKMTQIHTAAIILGCYFAIAHALVFDKCTKHDQCPQNSRCRPTGCDGYTCRCDPNYVHSHDRASCLPARKIGYSCNAKTSKCLSNFAICEDNVCRCNDLMEPTPEGRCKDPEFSVLEESCLTKPCSGGTVCEGDTCVCPQDMRRLTDEEFWIDAMNTDYCIDKDFSVDFCNGTRLPIPIPMLTTPPPSVNQPGGSLSDTTLSFPRSFTKIVSLVEQDADIYDFCSRHEQCPAHAQCRPEGCKGFSCLCDKGYMATTDRKSCMKAVKVNEACDTNTSCISPFAFCDGVCRCFDIFVPTKDGRCKLPDISFVGEECSLDECEYPATCVDGICRCVGEYREITSEEFWVDPTNIWQCAKNNTSLATCNGLNVTLPTAMTPPLPKINKETTPSNIISTTTGGKETTPFNILTTTITAIADITTKTIDEISSQSTKTTTTTNRQKTTLNVLDNGEHASESTTSSSSIVSTKPLNVESSTKSTTIQAKVSEKLQTTTPTSVSGTETTVDKNELSAATTTTAEMSKTTTKITTTTSENIQTASITTPTEKTVTDDPISDSSTTSATSHTSTFPTDDNSVILTKIKLTPTVNTNVGQSVGDFSTTQRSESMQVTSDITTTTTTVNKENNVESSVLPSADSSLATKKESSLDSNRNVINRSDSNLEASPSSEFPSEALSSTRSGTDFGLDENKMTTATTTTERTTQMATSSYTTIDTGKVVAQSTTTTSSVHPSSESANPDDRNLSRDSQTGSTTTRQPTTSTQSISTDDRNLSRDSQTSSPTNQPKTSTNFPFGPTINSYLCESLAFHCSEILCIPSNWVCNGEKDCPDGRDEDRSICNKDRVCPPDEYRCSNFRCIPGSWLCDTQEDCPNKEDESKAAGCLSPNTTATSVNTTAHVPEVPELKEKEPAEKSYTGTAGLGSLESIAIAAAAGLVFLINVIGIILALTRRNRRRKLDKKPPSTMNTSMTSSDDTESGNFKIPRPNVLYPPYYVKEDWNTWNSTHFTQYAEQMYAMDEHSDFYPGSLKTL